jgi:hypothetical protein
MKLPFFRTVGFILESVFAYYISVYALSLNTTGINGLALLNFSLILPLFDFGLTKFYCVLSSEKNLHSVNSSAYLKIAGVNLLSGIFLALLLDYLYGFSNFSLLFLLVYSSYFFTKIRELFDFSKLNTWYQKIDLIRKTLSFVILLIAIFFQSYIALFIFLLLTCVVFFIVYHKKTSRTEIHTNFKSISNYFLINTTEFGVLKLVLFSISFFYGQDNTVQVMMRTLNLGLSPIIIIYQNSIRTLTKSAHSLREFFTTNKVILYLNVLGLSGYIFITLIILKYLNLQISTFKFLNFIILFMSLSFIIPVGNYLIYTNSRKQILNFYGIAAILSSIYINNSYRLLLGTSIILIYTLHHYFILLRSFRNEKNCN